MVNSLPLVTVVMPIRNESLFIEQALAAVLAQDYPHTHLEVLVSDGMSTDDTRDIVRRVADQQTDIPVTIIDNPHQIVPTGLNLALKQAQGAIIVRVDGHCVIAADYVRRCVEHLLAGEEDLGGVGGPLQTVGKTPMSQTIALAMSSLFGVGDSSFRTVKDRPLFVDTIAFAAYPRAVLDAAGPLDEELVRNQDDEYNYRLRRMGYKLLLSPDIRSQYFSRSTLRSLWRQYFQYGFWKVRVMQKHPRQMRPRQFIPAALCLALMGSLLLTIFYRPFFLLFSLIAATYLAANLTVSLLVAWRHGRAHFVQLPVIFAVLHLSYGMGFLRGLIQHANRWKANHAR